ncbi:hypothetical protein [Candidatus Vallotiella sp. (ex Adelges kitamiensis)]|uniref:hypothetical protein n=1 Tax=Candidatus Vallotiella sp. (ex Adelges kitamiensis) TaxID=2864217 RepID=UPI001CE2FABD|nr:hypothetical protein [Candidatus Vallotia sp. (ex Adelges kitamiensis)]
MDQEAWWLAATNRWLTAAVAHIARYPDQTCLLQSLQKAKKKANNFAKCFFL